jgi:hypothetical protein
MVPETKGRWYGELDRCLNGVCLPEELVIRFGKERNLQLDGVLIDGRLDAWY